MLIYLHIDNRYAPIIRENTKFWNASGATVEGGIFSGITFKTESFEAILRGGIALATPEQEKSGTPAEDGHRFLLHDDYQSEWLDWIPDIVVLEKEQNTLPLPGKQ